MVRWRWPEDKCLPSKLRYLILYAAVFYNPQLQMFFPTKKMVLVYVSIH